jgi:CTP synthase
MRKNIKYVFVVGGVMSGVGKGITTASLANIFKYKGHNVTAMKIDPYINVDAGTMNPVEHGEVFVLGDGDECDQDMGNYERFLNESLTRDNYMTTGRVYQSVIGKERSLSYKGKCVQVVPHIPLEVINRIQSAADKAEADIVFIEIGGTVGEYENLLFLEAIKMLKYQYPDDVAVVMVTFLPSAFDGGEVKTKPTQHAVRSLNAAGLFVDIIIARSRDGIDNIRKEKMANACFLPKENIISAPNVKNIYDIVGNFEKDKISSILVNKLNIKLNNLTAKTNPITALARKISKTEKELSIGVIGKYFDSGYYTVSDSYISVIEAIKYSGYSQNVKVNLTWINSLDFECSNKKESRDRLEELKKYDAIIVPGGFGSRGVEGIIIAIKYVRENNIPFLGICYGMQLAVVEYARNVMGLSDAHTTEVDPSTKNNIIDIQENQKGKLSSGDMGNSMRLGDYDCNIKVNTFAYKLYKSKKVTERHRHRYEVNNNYAERLEKFGMTISGYSDNKLVEIIELAQNKYFIGIQSHPEFLARPGNTHPLFDGLIVAAVNNKSS